MGTIGMATQDMMDGKVVKAFLQRPDGEFSGADLEHLMKAPDFALNDLSIEVAA
jgi:hypothetical protein